MPRISVTNRNLKRNKLVDKFKSKRDELRQLSKTGATEEERFDAAQALQKMPRDASPTRRRNRCKLCSRPRAYNRLTGLCRMHMRIATMIRGMVPGMRKASW